MKIKYMGCTIVIIGDNEWLAIGHQGAKVECDSLQDAMMKIKYFLC